MILFCLPKLSMLSNRCCSQAKRWQIYRRNWNTGSRSQWRAAKGRAPETVYYFISIFQLPLSVPTSDWTMPNWQSARSVPFAFHAFWLLPESPKYFIFSIFIFLFWPRHFQPVPAQKSARTALCKSIPPRDNSAANEPSICGRKTGI